MLRSFHYAAFSALLDARASGTLVDMDAAVALAEAWQSWVCRAYLAGYLHHASDAPFMPKTAEELEVLVRTFLLEKALYELAYELNNRPDWAAIPLHGIGQILGLNSDSGGGLDIAFKDAVAQESTSRPPPGGPQLPPEATRDPKEPDGR